MQQGAYAETYTAPNYQTPATSVLGAVQPFAAAQQILGKGIGMEQLTCVLFFFIVMSVSIAVLRSVFARMSERVP